MGQMLAPIQSYCLQENLPPLTILVVNAETGLPGVGFIAAEDIPRVQGEVFRFDWVDYGCPSVEDFEAASSSGGSTSSSTNDDDDSFPEEDTMPLPVNTADRDSLENWVIEALRELGTGNPVSVAKHIWHHHKDELERSGDLFYTWQYDMRWAAQRLRDSGRLVKAHNRNVPWRLA
jgi:hypothetical protein